ncbi:MAG TPA: 2-dehydro-3-deoxygalactonokinase, partial [Planctomycetota bacterium]|nr:2-dehydro-3-deoxygalactonokinase [Planctomycetota bacterium]
FPLDGRGLIAESLGLDDHAVHILSGVRGDVDVMRGEETEILGLLSDPVRAALREDALFILPGTHSKHARLEGGAMVGFSTHLTGELLDLLRTGGILRHHVLPPPGDVLDGSAPAADGFRAGVAEGAEGPITNVLFRVRARSVLERKSRDWATAYLAGILIGAELAAARAVAGDQSPMVLSASRRHQDSYVLALEVLGLRGSTVLIEAAEGELAAVKGQALYLASKGAGVAS